MDLFPFVHSLGDKIGPVFAYIRDNPGEFRGELTTHLQLSGYALLIGIALCFPLGVLASRSSATSLYALNVVGVARAIPSVAILFVAYPLLGLGFTPALLALAVLACPPILINTNIGFRSVDPSIREAAYGMGMNTIQVLRKVELPLALPVVIAGVRTAAVEVVASATLAVFIGAGGLGYYVAAGLESQQDTLTLVGAIPVILLTLGAEVILGSLELFTRRAAGVGPARP
jgi:osmoprotectant transport system permease protein